MKDFEWLFDPICIHLIWFFFSVKSEALGLLANLGERCSPVDWNSLIDKQPLLSWIADHLQTGKLQFQTKMIIHSWIIIIIYISGTPFDVQLSAILVLSCIASVPEAAERLLEHQLPPILLNLLRSQQEDDEFVLQVRSLNFLSESFIEMNHKWFVFHFETYSLDPLCI